MCLSAKSFANEEITDDQSHEIMDRRGSASRWIAVWPRCGRSRLPSPGASADCGLEHYEDLQFALCSLLLGLECDAVSGRAELGSDGKSGR